MDLNLKIPMRDGVCLSGNLYRPEGRGPWPTLINYLPYHKDGRGGLWYDAIHRWFTAQGYASLVVDFRGLGASEGINNYPFDAQESLDGHDIVEWAGVQPWSDGNVGMWGTSYGGITALKAASQRPPHLKAIVPIHATADNYYDFLLLGGCRNGFWPSGDWGPRMIGYNLTPPLCDDPDGRFGQAFEQRLQHSRPWCLDWYDSRNEVARWMERVIPIDHIQAATLAVCGWKDFYVQGTVDYFNDLKCPKKLIMGPWKHAFPNLSPVTPFNLLERMLAWWDRWLRGANNQAEKGPSILLFVQGTGVWRQEEAWPPQRNVDRSFGIIGHRLVDAQSVAGAVAQEIIYQYDPTVGLDSIGFDPWTTGVVEQGDHNGDDARSLAFTSEPHEEPWDFTGQASFTIRVTPSVAGFNYVAKLCDVDPAGRSRLVTMGWCPDPGGDGQRTITIKLRSTSHVFRKGHRIRIGLALADFPRLWPTPNPGSVAFAPSDARLSLPQTGPSTLPEPQLAPLGPSIKSPLEESSSQSWLLSRDLVTQTVSMTSTSKSSYRLRSGQVAVYEHRYVAAVAKDHPAGASITVEKTGVSVEGVFQVEGKGRFTPGEADMEATVIRNDRETFRREWKATR